MPYHAGFAAAITVREHVLRTAVQAAYANGSAASKTFVEDLSDDGVGIVPDLFLGQPDIKCEGTTNLLVVSLPIWGQVTVTVDQVTRAVDILGEIELTVPPAFRTGDTGTDAESSVVLDPLTTATSANVRRWTATVTSADAAPEIVALVTGEEFRANFEQKLRLGFLAGRIGLPSIDASFLGSLVRKATSVDARVRNGVLLIGLNYTDATHALGGELDNLRDFAGSNDVAAVIHPDAVDVLLDKLYAQLVEGVEHADATLDTFSVRTRDGHFSVSGAASKSTGTVNFSFRIVPSMFHTRPGQSFPYTHPRFTRFVKSRTWPALEFNIEDVQTDGDRPWWLILFGEVIGGILTLGMSTLYIENLMSAAVWNFSARLNAAQPGPPTARVRRTIPPPGGIGVRISLDQFDITELGVYVGISVSAKTSPAMLLGPTMVPATYRDDVLRYILGLPSSVVENDPALRIQWILEDRTSNVVLQDSDDPAVGRLEFEFTSGTFTSDDYSVTARLYRQLGKKVTEIGTQSVNLRMRPPLPANAYVRWRSSASTPQIIVDKASDGWGYRGDDVVSRYSKWHRVDAPCLAVNATHRYRFELEQADRLPFSLQLLEDHRTELCPYCFYNGPAGINTNL